MWTETTRAQYRREDLRYASDIDGCGMGADRAPHAGPESAGATTNRASAECCGCSVLYFADGLSLASAARDFPNRSTVQRDFDTWRAEGLWERVNFLLVQHARERDGREASPSAGVIDSQSVKTTESGTCAPTR